MNIPVRIKHSDGFVDTNFIVAENSRYSLCKCTVNGGSDVKLLMVSNNSVSNYTIYKQFDILSSLSKEVERLASGSVERPDYGICFPHVCEFIDYSYDLNDRDAVVLCFDDRVGDFQDLIPLAKLCRGGYRVDLKTAAWIFGKLLKIIDFANNCGFEINDISVNNVLIHPDKHYVIVFDWSKCNLVDDVDDFSARGDVKKAANLVIKILGNNLDAVRVTNKEVVLTDFISKLSVNGMAYAEEAHSYFYGIIDSLCGDSDSGWVSGFHKFTVFKD